MEDSSPGMGRLLGTIALFAALGTPLLAVVWEALNQLLGGRVNGRLLLIALPALVLLLLLLRLLARTVSRVAAPTDQPGAFPPRERR
jgi:hypothetical protein